ncbi:Tubulin-specific chaperone D [Portunus trituberculatus]|uniref:Tubulin-specific chaperone D n=1 Tax=Portunus trituberculatus TaxID=210409 RepID=A0A5B7GP67_PORTR|nr:Tubulin-specific chaperone D [Portunus trituberculatus]
MAQAEVGDGCSDMCLLPFESCNNAHPPSTDGSPIPLKVLEKESQGSVYDVFHKLGVLRTLGLIFKHGKREEMLEFSQKVLPRLVACGVTCSTDTPIRKLAMKVIQRIGTVGISAEWADEDKTLLSALLEADVEGPALAGSARFNGLKKEDIEEGPAVAG